jgi:AcrR family transcriptional regulator
MIYYYFGDKEGLYLRALEASYGKVRQIEAGLRLEDLTPMKALRRLVEFTFDHHVKNQDYIRLVMSENIQRGVYLAQSEAIQKLNQPIIETIRKLYRRGVDSGEFRDGLDPVDIHASISALCFYNVSNQYTFGCIFNMDTQSTANLAARRSSICDMVLRYVLKNPF